MLTFEQCKTVLGSRTSKKLENNTYLVPLRGEFPNVTEFGVRLHNTHIIRITEDDYTLTSGGYQTATTKDRLNKYGPVRIWQKDHVWFWWPLPVTTGTQSNVFKDGLVIPSSAAVGC